MSSRKKKNFTERERCLILELIKEFKLIIENKKTDNASAQLKKQIWAKIAARYNASALVIEPATGEQLRRLWQNIKTRQREALTKERQHRIATGGGGPCPDANIDGEITAIAPALLVEIPEVFDSDTIGSNVEENAVDKFLNTLDEPPATLPQDPIHPDPTFQDAPAQDPTPQDLKTHQCAEPELLEELSSNEKHLRVQILKREFLNRERRAQELHELQMEFMKQKHNIEMQILQQQFLEAPAKTSSDETG